MTGPAWTPGTGGGSTTTLPYTAVNSTYGVITSDCVIECTSGTFTVTLPTAVGIEGQYFIIKNSGTGVITVDGYSSETIDGAANKLLAVQNESITVVSNDTNWIIV